MLTPTPARRQRMLSLYFREYCHLCEEAEALLAALALSYARIDIDNDPLLAARYGLRIPVLKRGDGQELDWPFDAERISASIW